MIDFVTLSVNMPVRQKYIWLSISLDFTLSAKCSVRKLFAKGRSSQRTFLKFRLYFEINYLYFLSKCQKSLLLWSVTSSLSTFLPSHHYRILSRSDTWPIHSVIYVEYRCKPSSFLAGTPWYLIVSQKKRMGSDRWEIYFRAVEILRAPRWSSQNVDE